MTDTPPGRREAAGPDLRAGPGDDPDDLAAVDTPLTRLRRQATRWLAALLAAGLLLPAGWWLVDEIRFRQAASSVVDTLEGEVSGQAIAGTVLLVRTVGCAPGTRGSGSGFVVDLDGGPAVVTNRHVVADARAVGLHALDGTPPPRVEQVHVSEIADVAVLRVADPQRLPPALTLRREPPAAGSDVRLVGFPASVPFTTEGSVRHAAPDRMLLDLEVAPGASGAPVVADDGRVVGQVSAVTADGLGIATPVDALSRAVQRTRPADPC